MIGCTTSEPSSRPETEKEQEPAAEKPPEEKSEEEPEKTVVEEEPEPEEEPEGETEPGPAEESSEEYQVSEEVFQQTFNDVEELIKELNKIIKSKDYETWLTYLTEDYKENYSDPEVLEEKSQQPTLKKYGIKLETLRDYFIYVVAPSRADARLDDLVFLDDNHVKAIMEINDHRVILYLLEKINGKWKIATRDVN